MMRSKRGVFMSLYLVMLTLLMCGLVLGFYISHQDRLKESLVSPLVVLEVSDGLELFEMRERELILKSLDNSNFEAEDFRGEFISGISEEMKKFIFSDLIVNGKEAKRDDSFFGVLYSVAEKDGDLILKRGKAEKRILLKAVRDEDITFPVTYILEFDAEYLISKDGSDFKVERVE